jgi:PAS domain S-box-containing protein
VLVFSVILLFKYKKMKLAALNGELHKIRAENLQILTDEKYGKLLTHINEYVYSVALAGTRPVSSTHSHRSLDITGYSPDEMRSDLNLWKKIVFPDDLDAVKTYFKSVISKTATNPIEHRIIHKDGSIRWVYNLCVARSDRTGNIIQIDGYIHDISLRKNTESELNIYRERLEELVRVRTEELAGSNASLQAEIKIRAHVESELRKSELTLRSILEAATDAVFLETLDGKILDCNSAAVHLFGYSTDEIKNLMVADLLPEGIEVNLNEVIEEELKHGLYFSEAYNRKKDGTVFPCEVNTRLIMIDGEKHVAAFIRDITSGKKYQDEIHKLTDELRMHILELETLNKELEAFNYSVSHDLKSPLLTIAGYSRIILKKYSSAIDPEALRYLNIINLNSLKMEQLIKDLMALSHSGYKIIERSEINIPALSREIFEETVRSISGRKINIAVTDAPIIYGDPGLIHHVMTNLIGNAVKYSSNRKLSEIEIGGWRGNNCKVIFVRDNGVGFDMKHAEKVFDAFYRIPVGEEFEGTGVGLSIVKRIISRHGGEVWVKSAYKKGTTFFFSIPDLD